MKLRLGFVSNSSSTSFVIGVPKNNLRGTLFAIFQKYNSIFEDLFATYNMNIETLVEELLPKFERMSHPWLNERENYAWFAPMKDAFGEAMESNLVPYYTKLDIVMQPHLEQFIDRIHEVLKSDPHPEFLYRQVKFP